MVTINSDMFAYTWPPPWQKKLVVGRIVFCTALPRTAVLFRGMHAIRNVAKRGSPSSFRRRRGDVRPGLRRALTMSTTSETLRGRSCSLPTFRRRLCCTRAVEGMIDRRPVPLGRVSFLPCEAEKYRKVVPAWEATPQKLQIDNTSGRPQDRTTLEVARPVDRVLVASCHHEADGDTHQRGAPKMPARK